MSARFKHSVSGRIMAAIMLASATGLLVAVVSFMIYDWVTFRRETVRSVATEARVLAANSSEALAFRDASVAANALASLHSDPRIIAAAFYDRAGRLLVKYPPQSPTAGFPVIAGEPGFGMGRGGLGGFEPVWQQDPQLGRIAVGSLYLQADQSALVRRFELYLGISGIIMLGALAAAYWLSRTLQRRIAEPIIALAGTARRVSESNDYSLRAEKMSEDELGFLTDALNAMLERVQASDAALRAREGQFRLVTDHSPVLLAHMGRDLRYRFVNRPYAEHYGRTPEEIVGKTAVEVVGPDIFARARTHVEKALRGEAAQFEMEISPAGTPPRWSHVAYTPEKSEAGVVTGFLAVHTDITARKRTEMEIERARDEALAASRAKDDFLAALSHELRTPLNPILLVASDGAINMDLPMEPREVFAMIRRNVEMEARLIDDLLDLSRITRGKLLLKTQPLDMGAVMREAIGNVAAEAAEKRLSLECDLPGKPQVIIADAVRLQQVFLNILKNAVKFTPEGGRVFVRRATLGGRAFMTVQDTGMGMTPAEIEEAFRPFSQGDHAGPAGSRQFGGLGLGLAISQSLVELHAGAIQATSEGRGKGSTITIEFPLASPDRGRDLAESTAAAVPRTVTNTATARRVPQKEAVRILLVEDHGPTRIALTHLLARRDYKVQAAASVAEARALVGRETFDLVVSDIGLPDGNGYLLMAELRDIYRLNGVALTGYGMDQDIVRAREAGFVGHLTKPVRVEALEQALLEAL